MGASREQRLTRACQRVARRRTQRRRWPLLGEGPGVSGAALIICAVAGRPPSRCAGQRCKLKLARGLFSGRRSAFILGVSLKVGFLSSRSSALVGVWWSTDSDRAPAKSARNIRVVAGCSGWPLRPGCAQRGRAGGRTTRSISSQNLSRNQTARKTSSSGIAKCAATALGT